MTISSELISQIVRNVMREMETHTSPADPAALTTKDTDTFRIEGKVISEGVLAAAQAAGRTISLSPGAVLTPSGRDYIRRNAVRLCSRMAGTTAGGIPGTVILVETASLISSAAAATGWKIVTTSTDFDAASIAAEQQSPGVVVGCREPSVVACLLNRNPALRVAVVTRETCLETLRSVMNPGIVCLESKSWAFGELLRLFRTLTVPITQPTVWTELTKGARR